MLQPKITPYDTKIIPQMYKDGYILTAIYDNKIFWHINQTAQYEEESQDKKKKIKEKSIVALNEYQLSISYLKNIEKEKIPDYAESYQDEWIKFCYYWSEKWKTWKIRAEWEKTFEIKRRFATWMSRKKETYQQKQKESALDITL